MVGVWDGLRRGVAAAAELVLPARCASCHGPGAPLCRGCSAGVRTASGDGGGPHLVRLEPPPSGMPSCWAGARFEGPLQRAVTAYKDEDRRDLRGPLGELLASALVAAVSADEVLRRRRVLGDAVLVVPMPTARASRRRRGDDPVRDLVASGVGAVGGGLVVVEGLAHTRAVADQAHLDRGARAAHLAGAMVVREAVRAVVHGAVCVLADDVVTTGTTLAEGARALRKAGAGHVVAVTVAATPRRRAAPLWPTGPPTSVRS